LLSMICHRMASAGGDDQPTNKCIDVRPNHPIRMNFEIAKSGCYVLQEDFCQRWVYTLPHSKQPFPAANLIDIQCNDVVLDLNGHLLSKPGSVSNNSNAAGVTAYINCDPVFRRITVKNGRISVVRGTPVSIFQQAGDSVLLHKPQEGWRKLWFPVAGSYLITPSGALDLYVDTDYVLEDLTLSTKSHAVLLQGRRNVIRRCRIVGCDSVVQSFGPDCLIEDCEIVLQYGNEFGFSNWSAEPVALRLEDAKGAVIRNNRFIINTAAGKDAGYVVALHNCQDVQFIGNTVEGVGRLYQADERSSVTETDTHIEARGHPRLFPWWTRI